MTASIFDSHKYAKRLMDAGVPAQAADVQAETMVEVMTQVAAFSAKLDTQDGKMDHMDAKIDVLAAKIDTVEAKLDAKIADAKADLIRWMVSLSVLQLSLISALLLKLTH